ncbi:multiheme c-type cytochrome [Roseobacter litoralis]|uniref:multiheme c-type cytochrome n=1 Tax=Roseobacter litoralis TaxID=42443 RepID=UPI002494B9F3|nr:multiheme c-type cytochrome [Roseobacter litoralis]
MFRFTLCVLILAVLSTGASAQGVPDQTPAYVGSMECRDCHTDAAKAWEGSHHAKAWTAPTAENILADFNDTEFRHDGTLTRFRVEDGRHHITVTEKDGVTTDYTVHSVAGIEPLQQYLLETEPGRIQSFDVVWDTVKQEWFHLYPDQDLPPDDGLHWTGPYKNWNARCAECHATGFEKNYSPVTRSYSSIPVEIGVGCEACHGPGSAHIEWAAGKSLEEPLTGLSEYRLTIDYNAGTETVLQQCASCHSRREAHFDGNPVPGIPFDDAYALALLRPGAYHADGQILDEVYVYGSFLQSKMYQQGVSCSNCHEAHSAELKAEGNGVCTQCHSPAGNPSFTTLDPKNYDDPSHHFHEVGTEGAQCKSCHMIERVYMGVDGRRDHSFRIPRPDVSLETESPNACTDCHSDQSSAWAAAAIEAWYPDSENRGLHYGQVLAAGRANAVAARGPLTNLAGDATQPGIARATALWLLEQSGDETLGAELSPMLNDPDPLVRAAAASAHGLLPPTERAAQLAPALDDPRRMVRIEAGKTLLDVPRSALTPSASEKLGAALREWQAGLLNRADFPETHIILAGTALTMRNFEGAERAFREVVLMDPQREEAWVMLVRIADAVRGPQAAAQVLDEALQAVPGSDTLNGMRSESLLPPQ